MTGRSAINITGIGSLPGHDPQQAVDYLWAEYSTPFLPELLPDDQLLAPLAGDIDHRAWQPAQRASLLKALAETPSDPELLGLSNRTCWHAFHQKIISSGPERVKLQLCGPATARQLLAKHLPDASEATLLATVHARLHLAIEATVAATGTWPKRTQVLLQFDEPCWQESHRPEDLTLIRQVTDNLPPNWQLALHSCAYLDTANLIKEFSQLWLSIDAKINDPRDKVEGQRVLTHLEQGGGWILGVVDTAAKAVASQTTLEFCRWIAANIPQEYRYKVMISGACGTGLQPTAFERVVSQTLQAGNALISATSKS